MVLIRATAKLLKRLRQLAKPPEPSNPSPNPLGEWYADVDFIDREPFVVMINAATGAGLVLPGRAAQLRELHVSAAYQLKVLFNHYGIESHIADRELECWQSPPQFAATRDRSLLGSLNRVKDDAWHHFAYHNRALPEAAARQWEGLFTHPSLGRGRGRFNMDYHRPLDLVRARLALDHQVSTLPGQDRLH